MNIRVGRQEYRPIVCALPVHSGLADKREGIVNPPASIRVHQMNLLSLSESDWGSRPTPGIACQKNELFE